MDLLFLPYFPRAILAIMSIRDEKLFQMYAKTRRATFFLNCVLLLGGVFAFIVLDIFKYGGTHYLYMLAALIGVLLYLGPDYHFTNCVVFYMKHPPKRKEPIEWLFSDSEPQFAF